MVEGSGAGCAKTSRLASPRAQHRFARMLDYPADSRFPAPKAFAAWRML